MVLVGLHLGEPEVQADLAADAVSLYHGVAWAARRRDKPDVALALGNIERALDIMETYGLRDRDARLSTPGTTVAEHLDGALLGLVPSASSYQRGIIAALRRRLAMPVFTLGRVHN